MEESTEMVDTEVVTNSEEETPSRRNFFDRASDMGLVIDDFGLYNYEDSLGAVQYKQLKTQDDILIPFLAVFTRPARDDEYTYHGFVSDNYNFVGHQVVIDRIKASVSEIESPIFQEFAMTFNNGCQMLDEIVIQNRTNIPDIGDVYPQLMITNGYNGTRAVNITFGVSIFQENRRLGFGFKRFGTMRQVHIQNAQTTISSSVGRYVDRFQASIGNFIAENSSATVNEDELLKVLELVEKLGVKRRDKLSMLLTEVCGAEGDGRNISRWNLFMAITVFSTIEKNLNTRLLLESVADRCLVFPLEMANVLSQIVRPT